MTSMWTPVAASSLWFTPLDVQRVRERRLAGEPLTVRLAELAVDQARRGLAGVLGTPGGANGRGRLIDGERFLSGCAVHHLLTGELEAADLGRRAMLAWFEGETASDLERAAMALHAALLAEACREVWSDVDRAEFTALLVHLHEGFRRPGQGNPHLVTNNWWGVTHAGALVAALAAHGRPLPGGGAADLSEGIAWATGRLRAFLQHFGDAGLYHEGLGYQCYTLSHLLPAVLALRGFSGADLADEFPALRAMGGSLFAAMSARAAETESDDPPRFGAMLSWNDADLAVPDSNLWSLLIGLAPSERRGAMRAWFDRMVGLGSPDRLCAPGAGGWCFHLFYYPFDTPESDPDAGLPLAVCDSRQGLAIYRNRYRDSDDAVLGVYARTTQIGGHRQDDAGSVRFMAMGHDWILGGGQARAAAEWQSRVTCRPGIEGAPRCGAVLWHEGDRRGAVFGVEMRGVLESYAERYVAARWPERDDQPVCIALLDAIDDHRSDRDWLWNLTYSPRLECKLHSDGAGFSLIGAGSARLDARFLGDPPLQILRQRMPDSERSFTTGVRRHYPGRPFLQAVFPRKSPLGIYVAMAVCRAEAPVRIERTSGLGVRVGDLNWDRPFGASIPASFEPGRSRGLCPAPHGCPVE